MTKTLRSVAALAIGCLLAVTAFAQNTQNGNAAGRYGLQSWAINNQRVASQYNYFIDSAISQGAALGIYNFPAMTCQQALAFNGNKNVNPFNTNASVKIVDINSSQTETVALNSITVSGGTCTLSLATSNTHSVDSYVLRSGTCGLQEAVNDLGTSGGEVLVDQKFYDDGCTQATITGINPLVTSTSGPVYGNTFVHDISNGQDTWYAIKPNTTTLISAGSAPTLTATTGGSLSNSTTYYVEYAYVDPIGGISLPSSEGSLSTGGSGTALTVTAPAATTGAVGYIPYFGSASNGELMPALTSSICTLTTLESIIPACAMSSNSFFGAVPSSTAKQQVEGTAHTIFAFQPVSGPPSTFIRASGTFQTQYLPFAQQSTVTTSGLDIAEVYLPAGYFNYLGKSWDVCVKVNGTGGASGTFKLLLNAANQLLQSPVTLQTTTAVSASSAAFEIDGCFTMVTAATGSSGTFWSNSQNMTGDVGGTITAMGSTSTAASSAVNLTQGVWLSINGVAGTASATSVTVNLLSIRPTPGT